MKRILAVLLTLLPICSLAQVDYDKYIPEQYYPESFIPNFFRRNLRLPRYQEKQVSPTVIELKTLLEKSDQFPEVQRQFLGDLTEYNKLVTRYQKRGKLNEDIGKNKAMAHFQEDWTALDKFLFAKECRAIVVRDSLAWRDQFVRDSLERRKEFVADSLEARESFVTDSLYRDAFRKEGNYDYVKFDGPGGRPILCYRDGKIIDGKTYNSSGLVEKVYEDGVLIHDYQYSEDYIRDKDKDPVGFDVISTSIYTTSHYVYDAAQKQKTYYTNVKEKKIDKIEYFDDEDINYKSVYYESGEPYLEVYIEYYPDKKTHKRIGRIKLKTDETSLSDYYSDGTIKETRYYRAESEGGAIKRREIQRDGYEVIEYYDFNGHFERQETKYKSDPLLWM